MDKPTNTLDENKRWILSQIISKAFQEIRLLAWNGKSKQAGDLADAFHNVPSIFYGVSYGTIEFIKSELTHYQSKYHQVDFPEQFDYIKFFTENWEK